jgi:hypothetical protein
MTPHRSSPRSLSSSPRATGNAAVRPSSTHVPTTSGSYWANPWRSRPFSPPSSPAHAVERSTSGSPMLLSRTSPPTAPHQLEIMSRVFVLPSHRCTSLASPD